MLLRKLAERKIRKETDKFKKAGVMRSFHYDFGSMGEGVTSYTITEDNGSLKLIYQVKSMQDGTEERKEAVLLLTVMQVLKKIISDNKIFLWNGFNKSNSVIATGKSFNLKADFDYYSLKANGMVMMPVGYSDGHEALTNYLNDLLENNL